MRPFFKNLLYFLLLSSATVRGQECPGNHEVYTECGPSCGGEGCNPIMYFAICKAKCQPGCFCECGYFRNEMNQCVPPEQCKGGKATNVGYLRECPGKRCDGDYEYYTRSNSCVDNCPPLDGSVCNALWNNPGCFCLPGYKKMGGLCIPEEECPSLPFLDWLKSK